MVTGSRTELPSLGRAERLAVLVFSWLLPVSIRARQRDEWAADLIDVGIGERGRYLFWAGWTLPALRAVARRGGPAGADGPSVVLGASGVVPVLARITLIGLGWPVSAWLVAVPGHYWLKGVLGHELTAEPSWWGILVFELPDALLVIGAYTAVSGGPFLIAAFGLAAVLVGLTRRGANHRLRVAASLAGAAAMAFGIAVIVSDTASRLIPRDTETSYSTGAVGAAAVTLGLTASGLSRRMRVVLVLIGLGGLAVLVAQHTETGTAMRIWFYD